MLRKQYKVNNQKDLLPTHRYVYCIIIYNLSIPIGLLSFELLSNKFSIIYSFHLFFPLKTLNILNDN